MAGVVESRLFFSFIFLFLGINLLNVDVTIRDERLKTTECGTIKKKKKKKQHEKFSGYYIPGGPKEEGEVRRLFFLIE